jgi:hypothetical protein
MKKINILIDCKWVQVKIREFIAEIRLNKNIGTIYLVSTRENNVMQYENEFEDCELIVYNTPFILEDLGNCGLTSVANTNYGFTTTIKDIDDSYNFDPKKLDNMDTATAFVANNRCSRRLNYSLYSVEYGIDVYNFFLNLFRMKNISFVYSLTQSHYSSDYMLNKAAMDSGVVKNVVHKRCMGFPDKGMYRFCLIDTLREKFYKSLPRFDNDYISEAMMYRDAGYENKKAKKYNFISSLVDKFRVFDKLTPIQSFKVIRKKVYDNLYFYPFYLFKLYEYYESLCENPNFEEKYILMSLHFEPESTIAPVDGINSLQLYNLKILSSTLPDGWKIYVREHPTQFKKVAYKTINSFIESLPQYKNKNFYKYISKIPNVRVISVNEDQKKLIQHAEVIASSSGSVFIEASSNNKPCLAFGKLAFASMFNNVWSVSDVDSCREALKEIRGMESIISDYKDVVRKYSMQMKKGQCWLSPAIGLINSLHPNTIE